MPDLPTANFKLPYDKWISFLLNCSFAQIRGKISSAHLSIDRATSMIVMLNSLFNCYKCCYLNCAATKI